MQRLGGLARVGGEQADARECGRVGGGRASDEDGTCRGGHWSISSELLSKVVQRLTNWYWSAL